MIFERRLYPISVLSFRFSISYISVRLNVLSNVVVLFLWFFPVSGSVGTSGGYAVYEDRQTFYTALAEFVEDGVNARFQSDLVYNDDGEIEASLGTTITLKKMHIHLVSHFLPCRICTSSLNSLHSVVCWVTGSAHSTIVHTRGVWFYCGGTMFY